MPAGLALDLRVKPGTQAEVGPVDERARRRGLCLLRPSATARWFEEFRLHELLCLPELQPQIREACSMAAPASSRQLKTWPRSFLPARCTASRSFSVRWAKLCALRSARLDEWMTIIR